MKKCHRIKIQSVLCVAQLEKYVRSVASIFIQQERIILYVRLGVELRKAEIKKPLNKGLYFNDFESLWVWFYSLQS